MLHRDFQCVTAIIYIIDEQYLQVLDAGTKRVQVFLSCRARQLVIFRIPFHSIRAATIIIPRPT